MTPFLGAHVSVAGGVSVGLERAERIRCEAAQIFAKNNKCWREAPLEATEVRRFRDRARAFGRRNLVSHAGYLINLCGSDRDIHRRSMASMQDELVRAETLGLAWVVLHPGSHGGRGEAWGLGRVAESLTRLLKKTAGFRAGILLETTAGQGNSLGWKFEHLRSLRRAVRSKLGAAGARRLGVCVDTCHIFAAGYEIRSRRGYEATMSELDRAVGLRAVRAFHLNDSLRGLGSRVDRHEHIGRGEIGLDAFRFLLNDRRFGGLPMVLETPKGPDMKEDVMNLRTLRGLLE